TPPDLAQAGAFYDKACKLSTAECRNTGYFWAQHCGDDLAACHNAIAAYGTETTLAPDDERAFDEQACDKDASLAVACWRAGWAADRHNDYTAERAWWTKGGGPDNA